MDNQNDLKEKVFNNFIYDIAEFMNKQEKMLLREVCNRTVYDLFSEFKINISFIGDNIKHLNPNNYCLKNLLQHYRNIEKLTLDNINVTKDIVGALEEIVENNKLRTKILNLHNVIYSDENSAHSVFEIINKFQNVNEIYFAGVGIYDELINCITVNNKKFILSRKITTLKLDNITLKQILNLIPLFINLSDLIIENCSLDEDLYYIAELLIKLNTKLNTLNLSFNGLSSPKAKESLRFILKKQRLKKIILRGLWFHSFAEFEDEFNQMKELESIELVGSKYLFNNVISMNAFRGNSILNLKSLNLGDCRMEDDDLEHLLNNINSHNIEELIFYRNYLTNKSIDIIDKYKHKLKNLKILNLSFNNKIGSKAIGKLIGKLDDYKCLNYLDFRGTAIFLKITGNDIIKLINSPNISIKCIDLCFTSFNNNDYISFINSLYKKTIDKCLNKNIGLKIMLKLNSNNNNDLFNKVKEQSFELYKKFNILIK